MLLLSASTVKSLYATETMMRVRVVKVALQHACDAPTRLPVCVTGIPLLASKKWHAGETCVRNMLGNLVCVSDSAYIRKEADGSDFGRVDGGDFVVQDQLLRVVLAQSLPPRKEIERPRAGIHTDACVHQSRSAEEMHERVEGLLRAPTDTAARQCIASVGGICAAHISRKTCTRMHCAIASKRTRCR